MHATFDRNSLFPSFFIFKYKKITLFVHSFVRVFFLISIFLIEMTCRLTDVTLKMFIKQNHCCVLPVLFGIRVFSAFIATLFFGYISLLTANTVAVCFSFSLSLSVFNKCYILELYIFYCSSISMHIPRPFSCGTYCHCFDFYSVPTSITCVIYCFIWVSRVYHHQAIASDNHYRYMATNEYSISQYRVSVVVCECVYPRNVSQNLIEMLNKAVEN